MIDKKWKWVAKDENNQTYLFIERPVLTKDNALLVWKTQHSNNWHPCNEIISLQDNFVDSLYEIIHHADGKIEFRKARPDLNVDDPVLVRVSENDEWVPRHFSGWDDSTGKIRTFDNGQTSFTAEQGSSQWEQYKLP